MADVSEFYEAMKPRIKDAIHYVDGFDIKALPIPVQKLFYLTFGYSEAAIAVEIFKIPGVTDVPFPSGFSVTREMYSPAAAV